jgi:hypothetical protein
MINQTEYGCLEELFNDLDQKFISLYEIRMIISAYRRKEIKINRHKTSHMCPDFNYDNYLQKIRSYNNNKKIETFTEYDNTIKAKWKDNLNYREKKVGEKIE